MLCSSSTFHESLVVWESENSHHFGPYYFSFNSNMKQKQISDFYKIMKLTTTLHACVDKPELHNMLQKFRWNW
jgi:hypothetical protein